MHNKNKFFLYLVSLIIISLMACSKNDKKNIEFKFNANNEYIGFKDLNFISLKEAEKNGYVIYEKGYPSSGQELWDNFLKDSLEEINTQIRIYKVNDDMQSEYIDIFYRNNLYYVFSSNATNNKDKDNAYKYLYDLNNTTLNNTFFIVASNSSDITYTKVINSLLSSKLINTKDFRILIMGMR